MRLFLALEIPTGIRKALRSLQDELRSRSEGWRWTRPDAVHLTIRFLGEVSEQAAESQRSVWRETAAEGRALRIAFKGVGVFPNERSPRILWVGALEEPATGWLPALAAAIERAAVSLRFEPEKRPFRPHLTLARASGHGRPLLKLPREPVELGRALFGEVVLFRSILSPGGATYVPLESFPLGRGEDR
jgi:RNA 2',3'-cyclic 3'-phosphodiesterase